MKNTALLLGFLLVALCRSHAQVVVEVVMHQDQYLPGEAVLAKVEVANRSGQTLFLGADQSWLNISVESKDGIVVAKNADVPVVGPFTLESSKRAIKEVDLAPYFDLLKPGRYTVTATVFINDWNRQFPSKATPFDVILGSKMWEQEVGVPKAPGDTNRVPELRTYALQEANYLKQLMLYFQLTGRSGRVYKVFPIGPMLSFGQPDPKVDQLSNLHVLYQTGARSFSYTVFNTDGDLLLRQTYDVTTRPRLKLDESGNIQVVGGQRRITSSDVPPPQKLAEENAQTPQP